MDTTYFASRHTHAVTVSPSNGNMQQYRLYPNPNNGSFILQQYIQDEQPVKVAIYDMMGRSVYDNTMLFANARASVRADYPPGMYLMEITDSKNQIFRVKFVISK